MLWRSQGLENTRLKVFLVEDEMLIREGVKNSIEWKEEGYEFVGEASDGELALPAIIKEKPDIVITDIRMPFMDGLELSRMIRKGLPSVKIVILSGYDDFSYAKEAIGIGVTEYLLKPISSEKLLETLNGISEKIKQEQEDRDAQETYYKEMQENMELRKMKFFAKLVSGELSLAEAMEEGKEFDMNLSAREYTIILFKISLIKEGNAEQQDFIDAFGKIKDATLNLEAVYSFQRSLDGWAFLIMADDDGVLEERVEKLKKMLEEIVSEYSNIEFFGGIGEKVLRLRELGKSFEQADKAFAARFTHEPNQIIDAEQIRNVSNGTEFDVNNFGQLEKSRKVLEKFLNSGAKEEIHSFVNAFTDEISDDNFKSLIICQYLLMNIYVTVMSFCEKMIMDSGNTLNQENVSKRGEELKQVIATVRTRDDIKEYVDNLLSHAIEVRNEASKRRYSDIIQTAKDEIETKYMEESISLNSVAAIVGMSPSYFSTVFSKEIGHTFVEYLTMVRIDKAKEMLTCTDMKTSEIGYEVGYKDSHYFSYIFKKTAGCSPKEYRQGRKGKE